MGCVNIKCLLVRFCSIKVDGLFHLDTNVWISVLLNRLLAKNVVPLIEQGKISVYLSKELSKELARVLTYPKIRMILEKADVDPAVALSSILSSARLLNLGKLSG